MIMSKIKNNNDNEKTIKHKTITIYNNHDNGSKNSNNNDEKKQKTQ